MLHTGERRREGSVRATVKDVAERAAVAPKTLRMPALSWAVVQLGTDARP
ncbi:hypothetical protein [Lacisediminihabitans sp.]|jgi:hypothetical protein